MKRVSPQRDGFREELLSEQRAPSFSAQEAATLFADTGIHRRNYPLHQIAGGGGFQHDGVLARFESLGILPAKAFLDGTGRRSGRDQLDRDRDG